MYHFNKELTSIPAGTKILFACFPADGHFNPLTGLAMHLKEKGCDVRWYTSSYYAAKLKRLGIPHFGFEKAVDTNASKIEEIFPERANHKTQVTKLVFDMIHAFILRGPEYYQDVKAIRKKFAFDLVIADVAFTGIPFIKEKMKVPVISVGVFPLTETSKDLPPAGLGLTPSNSFFGKIKQNILRLVADKILFAKPNKVMNDVLADYGIDGEGLNLFDLNIKKSSLFFQSGTPGFEYKRTDLGKNIRFIGPLLPYAQNKLNTLWYDDRLRRFEKVILVTQGTVEKDINKLIVPTLEAFKNSNYLVVVTTGGSKTKELRELYPDTNFIIEDFIPFEEVMPYADVYVSNGGYGGVLLSIQHQLPMVVAGVHEGKNEICSRIGYFNLGINLKTELPSAEQLQIAINQVFADNRYSESVKKLAGEFRQYNPNELGEQYVAELVGIKQIATFGSYSEVEIVY
jgi:MGT family glycosyltransferase